MQKERLTGFNSYTPWERMWLGFGPNETPGTLKLAKEYLDAHLHEGDKVLEIGSGSGRVSDYLARKKGVTVVGIDINPKEVEYANEHWKNKSVSFLRMDGTKLKCESNSFDATVLTGVIGGVELRVRRKLLSEAFRVLKPGKTIAVSEFKMNLEDPKKREKYIADAKLTGEWGSKIIRKNNEKLFYAKHFTDKELTRLLDGAGFCWIHLVQHVNEAAGIGDNIFEKRQQYTAWGVKPGAPWQERLL